MSEPPVPPPGEEPPRGPREIPPGYRMHNGELVPAEQPAITRIMPATKPQRPKRWWRPDLSASRLGRLPGWFPITATLVVLVLFLVVIALNRPSSLPEQERQFLAIVKRGQDAVRHGNDITLVTARRQRAADICALLPRDLLASGWEGTITSIGTVAGSEDGELRVSIADGVQLKTWTSAGEDRRDHTLVSPSSPLYDALSKLKKGDHVTFTGTFARRGPACVQETSLFARNGMLTPTFVFRFTAVARR